MTTKIDLTKVETETLVLKMILRIFEKVLLVPGMEVLSAGGSPDGIGDIELLEHLHREIGYEIQNDLDRAKVEA